ncbi:EAL domain-containing protein [Nitrosomonas sp.]|uniref:EAL domain-containing protein n=1 Tax=Nitrosomonas sp. TaxID=42353 RepID=UPI00283F4998|nr:EAL domain-containing protein [Nitrosomonas sp.]MDR4514435.1 EAL domain-containing protein [Nitrosomonas sp.]
MKPEKKIFHSKVARRMLMFFVLSTFIPVSFLAYLSYSESNDMLLKKAHHQLAAASNSYNKVIYERLLLAEQVLQDAVTKLINGSDTFEADIQLIQRIRSLTLLRSDGSTKKLLGEPQAIESLNAAALKHLASGRTVLMTQSKGAGNNIVLMTALNAEALEKGILIAQIKPDYLWGDPESLPLDIGLCVTNEQYAVLFCANKPEAVNVAQPLKQIAHRTKGEYHWDEGDIRYIANYQEIFLEPHFLTPRWLVAAIQPEADALDNMARFRTIFWGSVILSVLVILLFSMIQIRRVLVPLEKLIEGTRRLGNRDFATQVDVISADEFGELAASFNKMTAQLGVQFKTMTALSLIDREILSGLNIDKIVRYVLAHLYGMIRADFSAVSVFDQDAPEKAVLHLLDLKQKHIRTLDYDISSHMHQLLQVGSKGVWIDRQTIDQLDLNQKIEPALKRLNCLFILPLNWKDQMVGYISLGFRTPPNWDQKDAQRIHDFADRVAVALFTKNREELLLRQARIDALTELPNRFLFMEQLQKEIAQNQRNERRLAVLYIDLDRFKMVNDSYGHSIGDELLREAGERLHGCVYQGDTVARLGGDEFAIIISELDSEQAAQSVAEKIIAVLNEPFIFNNEKNVLAASIGIAIYPQDGESIADLMRNADIAMYRAKEKGGNRYIFFEENMNAEVNKRAAIERELRNAIVEGQFVLYYQPQVEPKSGLVQGVETLVRWNHPERGFVSPGVFIPIAENTSLIVDVGRIILKDACAQFRQWLNDGIQLDYIAVNVSVKQFQQPDFFQLVEHVLEVNQLPPHCLELEITESVLMDDTQVVMAMLEKLKNLGVQLSIDDFGTGYSSMSYLEQLPFDTIKIDMSFVRKIQENGEGGTIAATIAAMAHALNKKIVAEGVEIQAQLDFLTQCNCELIQGYIYSRPLPADELAAYVRKNHAAVRNALSEPRYLSA